MAPKLAPKLYQNGLTNLENRGWEDQKSSKFRSCVLLLLLVKSRIITTQITKFNGNMNMELFTEINDFTNTIFHTNFCICTLFITLVINPKTVAQPSFRKAEQLSEHKYTYLVAHFQTFQDTSGNKNCIQAFQG